MMVAIRILKAEVAELAKRHGFHGSVRSFIDRRGHTVVQLVLQRQVSLPLPPLPEDSTGPLTVYRRHDGSYTFFPTDDGVPVVLDLLPGWKKRLAKFGAVCFGGPTPEEEISIDQALARGVAQVIPKPDPVT